MEKIAFYGGSFDPPHKGHLAIARTLKTLFSLDRFIFIPAHHAPHKKDKIPASPMHRLRMLKLASLGEEGVEVSPIETETPEKPYTFQTLGRLQRNLSDADIYFVIGADSWQEITTWREWERVLTTVNIIVVTRPGHQIGFDHVGDEILERVVDLRSDGNKTPPESTHPSGLGIFITDAVYLGISATEIRSKIAQGDSSWRDSVPEKVAEYIEEHGLYR